jgi:hypothetical protein
MSQSIIHQNLGTSLTDAKGLKVDLPVMLRVRTSQPVVKTEKILVMPYPYNFQNALTLITELRLKVIAFCIQEYRNKFLNVFIWTLPPSSCYKV